MYTVALNTITIIIPQMVPVVNQVAHQLSPQAAASHHQANHPQQFRCKCVQHVTLNFLCHK